MKRRASISRRRFVESWQREAGLFQKSVGVCRYAVHQRSPGCLDRLSVGKSTTSAVVTSAFLVRWARSADAAAFLKRDCREERSFSLAVHTGYYSEGVKLNPSIDIETPAGTPKFAVTGRH